MIWRVIPKYNYWFRRCHFVRGNGKPGGEIQIIPRRIAVGRRWRDMKVTVPLIIFAITSLIAYLKTELCHQLSLRIYHPEFIQS